MIAGADASAIAAIIEAAPTVTSAAFRLKTTRQRLRAFCVADDVLRPLFYKLADRGRARRRSGKRELEFSEAGK